MARSSGTRKWIDQMGVPLARVHGSAVGWHVPLVRVLGWRAPLGNVKGPTLGLHVPLVCGDGSTLR